MKNIKMLLLVPAVMICYSINAFKLEDYLTGSQTDKKGRSLIHIGAKNCDDLAFLSVRIALAIFNLSQGPDIEFAKDKVSPLLKDNQGKTALDIAEEKYEKTGHSDCLKMIINLKERMKKADEAEQNDEK